MSGNGLTMTKLRAILPEVEAAEAIFWKNLETCRPDADYRAICAEFNLVLVRAAEAIYLDTADVNSRETIMMAFGTPKSHGTCFGISPEKTIRALIKKMEGDAA